MKKDLVSIVIPCYNAELYLEDCLNALFAQTYKNLEIIVVNDGSTDNSEKILDSYVEKFKKNNMILIKINQVNQGQAVAVDNALKKVSGEFLMWQDADDWYQKDAVENMVNFLKNNTQYDFVRGEVAFRNEDDIDNIAYIGKSNYPSVHNIFDFYIFENDSYCYPGIFMTRIEHFDSCIKNRSIYRSRAGQNWQLILPISYNGKCGYLDKIVYNYRIVSNSHSHSVVKIKGLLKRCDQHKDLLFHVLDGITEMPKKVRIRYKRKIRVKYVKKKIRIILHKFKQILKGE